MCLSFLASNRATKGMSSPQQVCGKEGVIKTILHSYFIMLELEKK